MKLRVITGALIAGSLMPHVALAEPLKEVIRKALQTNPEVMTAVANRQVTQQEMEFAKAPQLPTLDLRVGGGREWSDSASTRDHGLTLTRTEQMLTARQMLYDGGATELEVARQNARLSSMESRVLDTSSSVGQRISDIYIEVIKANELYELAKKNLEVHQSYLSKMQDRVNAGAGQRADLQLAEGREALASTTLTNREAGVEDAKIRYRRMVGDLPRDVQLPDTLTRAIPPLLELATEIAYANNAALKAAKADVTAAQEGRSGAMARFKPTVNLEGGVTRNRNVDGSLGPNSDASLMVVMNYNLFRGGADEAKVQESVARLAAATETENNIRRTIEEEVGRAWVALNAARASLKYLEEHVKRTEEVLSAYQAQFDIGRRTMLDLMNAENELFQARSSLTTGRYAVLQGEYRLVAAMGGLLKVLDLEKAA